MLYFTHTRTVRETVRNEPYGFQKHNGLNFVRSVKNPNSRLAKVIEYLRICGPSSRRAIAVNALGMSDTVASPRGWNAYVFSGAVTAGFIEKVRSGRRVFYKLGSRSSLVV